MLVSSFFLHDWSLRTYLAKCSFLWNLICFLFRLHTVILKSSPIRREKKCLCQTSLATGLSFHRGSLMMHQVTSLMESPYCIWRIGISSRCGSEVRFLVSCTVVLVLSLIFITCSIYTTCVLCNSVKRYLEETVYLLLSLCSLGEWGI